MAGRSLLSAFLLFVVLSCTAHAKLSRKETKIVTSLRSAAVSTYEQDSFSVQTHSQSKTTLSLFGFAFTQESEEEQETVRVARGGDRVDFYGTIRKTETMPFTGSTSTTVEEVVIGDEWWAKQDGSAGWTQPDPEDPDNEELVDDREYFQDDATGSELMKALITGNIASVESIGDSCYNVVPTKEALLEDAGSDEFGRKMVEEGEVSGSVCVDSDTGLLASVDISVVAGEFSVEVEGHETTVQNVDVKSKTTFSKFGEPVDFPDTSPPTIIT
ncbi:hypothetical protein BSKO_05672 [Bryopsis sp. KO-2023]|nr:hypothetical protein BSKO_05672 [Bryopsis sp. KO-2023]